MTKKARRIAAEEAKERMEILGIEKEAIDRFDSGELTVIYVDHAEKRIVKGALSDEELALVRQIEEKQDAVVYYMIKDTVCWPDGVGFERYTMAFVDTYTHDYEMIKEGIRNFGALPAYVYNADIPDYSGVEEFAFSVFSGVMINAS